MNENETTVRVWKEGPWSWWAEFWRPLSESGSRSPFEAPDRGGPPPVPGSAMIGLANRVTRWGALRAARRMDERYRSGRPPKGDRPVAEAVRVRYGKRARGGGEVGMNVRIETRCRKRTWLPRWMPGNVESHILVDDLERDEAIGFADECFALPHVFAVMVEMPDELYLLGGVRVVEA